MDTTPQDRTADIENLRRLWNKSPGTYWDAFKKSGLSAEDVWPEDAKRIKFEPKEKLEPVSKKSKS